MNALLLSALSLYPIQQGERVPLDPAPAPVTPAAGHELALYDVGHLIDTKDRSRLLSQLKSDTGKPVTAAGLEALEEYAILRKRAEASLESVRLAVRDAMEPPFDGETNRAASLEGETLAIVASAEQHASVRAFLEHAAGFEGLVDVQSRLYFLEPGGLSELGRERSGEVLDSAQLETLLTQLDRDGVESVVAPRLVAYPFQRAELSVIDRLTYIADYEIRILPGADAEVADPVVETADSGVLMALRCVPLTSGELALDARIEHTRVVEPVPTQEITVGARGHRVTIQVPEITRVRLEGRFEMLPGQTLVMATTDPSGHREVLVLVRAGLVDELPSER